MNITDILNNSVNKYIKQKVPNLNNGLQTELITKMGNSPLFNTKNLFNEAKTIQSESSNNMIEFIKVAESLLPNAGMGAFTKKMVPKGSIIGQIKGLKYTNMNKIKDTSYVWKYFLDKANAIYIDSKPILHNNPLRYVNGAKSEGQMSKVNCKFVSEGINAYYKATKDIYPNEELITNYGKAYWQTR
jgi:hypothetical protein